MKKDIVNNQTKKNNFNQKSKPKNTSKRLGFKESRELKDLNVKLPQLEEKKMFLEKRISENDGNLSELSHELASTIETIQKSEDRWIELSELTE